MIPSKDQSKIIQIIRGLAIIAVAFIHNTPADMAQVWCRPFINFGVGTFLFLSGMLSSADRWKPRKRILKVLIPYIIWTFFYTILNNVHTLSDMPIELVKGLFYGSSAPMMYYILVYIEFTLLIPIIDKLARSKYKYLGFIISPIEIIVMRLIPLITGFEINRHVSIIMSISFVGWFTYFYLGYLIGNGMIKIKTPNKKLLIFEGGGIALQVVEGYWYISMGSNNPGTQLKMSAILCGTIFVVLVYKWIFSESKGNSKILRLIGNCSFGIYFSHIAIMKVLKLIPGYSQYIIYPFNAIIAVMVSLLFVILGRKILGKHAKYLALGYCVFLLL